MNPAKLQRHHTTRRTSGILLAPLTKWCRKAIPRWVRCRNTEPAKADDNDWSFKDKTLPWNDEVSDDTLWDEGEASVAPGGIESFRGTLPEWNEADILDSARFDDAMFYSDGASFYAHDDTSQYPDDEREHDADDALEDYLNSFFDEMNRPAVDDASHNPDDDDADDAREDYLNSFFDVDRSAADNASHYSADDDERPYFNDYSSIEIDYDAYPSDIDMDDDDDDSMADAVNAYLDLHL